MLGGLETETDKGTAFPLETLEGTQPCWCLDFSPGNPFQSSHLQNPEILNVCCFEPRNVWHFVRVGSRKLLQTSRPKCGWGARGPRNRVLWWVCHRQEPHGSFLPPLCGPAVSQERYTCPSLTLHPREPVFLAQTNGNYLALFSAVWPYRMSRRRRYEGHKVPLPVPRWGAERWSQSLPRTMPARGLGPWRAQTLCPGRLWFLFPR